jgi:CHAT domain-containing protein
MQTRLVQTYGPRAGAVAPLETIQAALPADTALIAWVDLNPTGPDFANPDGEHWGVVVRARGAPVWVTLQGSGPDHHWTGDDRALPGRVSMALKDLAGPGSADWRTLVERLYAQRLAPMAGVLTSTPDGLPAARRLIVLPSRALTGVPVEALLQPGDPWTISYAPSATILTDLRQRPRPDPRAGLLAVGDPDFSGPAQPTAPGPLPDHGLLLATVVPGSNAASRGLKRGDVLLAYNGTALHRREDLKVLPAPGDPVSIEVWRDGQTARRDVARGNLGVEFDPQPARLALEAQRGLEQLLAAARAAETTGFVRLPGTRFEVGELARLFEAADRPVRLLLDDQASEPELDRLASSGALGRFGFIHLATHGIIDVQFPQRSAVILTQTGLPDPLTQVLAKQPVYDGRLVVHEIQHDWDLHAELVTLSACETARGQFAGGEGFVGFTQALLMSGTRSVCLSLWKVDDTATALLMRRFYANLLDSSGGRPRPKAEALAEAKAWLCGLRRSEAEALAAALSEGPARGKGAPLRRPAVPHGGTADHPYDHPYYWAAFVLIGDPD